MNNMFSEVLEPSLYLQRVWKDLSQAHYIRLHQHQSYEHQHGGSFPSTSSAQQRQPESTTIPWLQENSVISYLMSKRNFTSLHWVIVVSGHNCLFSDSLTNSSVSLSCPPCQIILWSEMTISEQLNTDFPFRVLVATPRYSALFFNKRQRHVP